MTRAQVLSGFISNILSGGRRTTADGVRQSLSDVANAAVIKDDDKPLLNTTITTPATGDIIKWDGTKWVNGSRSVPRVARINTATDIIINSDVVDVYSIDALATYINSVTITGTPSPFQKLTIMILDNGSPGGYGITWGTAQFFSFGSSPPGGSTTNKRMLVDLMYDSILNKWGFMSITYQT